MLNVEVSQGHKLSIKHIIIIINSFTLHYKMPAKSLKLTSQQTVIIVIIIIITIINRPSQRSETGCSVAGAI